MAQHLRIQALRRAPSNLLVGHCFEFYPVHTDRALGETAPSQESFPLFGAANVAGKTTQPFWTAEPVTTDGLQAASLPAAEDTLPAEIDEGALNT